MNTSEFQYHKIVDYSVFFKTFNPVQTAAMQFLNSNRNLVLSAPTGSGKTEIAEFYACESINRGCPALMLFPFKSISEEKFAKWTDLRHGFSRQPKIIMTGDYQLTEKRKGFLERASLIVATSEMLDHRTRHAESEKSQWLKRIGVLIVDEAHLLTDKDRGHKLESAIMRFVRCNPGARIILLSATMPNVEELSAWLTHLTGRATDLYQSDYRPVKLTRHFEGFYDKTTYQKRREIQMQKCTEIIARYPQDQFLVFTSAKNWGRQFLEKLQRGGITSEFHNADRRRDELNRIESEFKSGRLRVLVATSTLGAGVNLPARRVIIPHVTWGLGEDVPSYEIHQKEGRSGRLGLDSAGDSYILVPSSQQSYHTARIEKGETIISQLRREDSLCFHLLGEILYGSVKDLHTAFQWYSGSFAYHQTQQFPSEDALKLVFNKLVNHDMVSEKQGVYQLTRLGKVCAMFYLNPFDTYAWFKNLQFFFKSFPNPLTGQKLEDVLLSFTLGNIPSTETAYPNLDSLFPVEGDPDYISFNQYTQLLGQFGLPFSYKKGPEIGYLIYCLLNGLPTGDINFSIVKSLTNDHERLIQAFQTMDGLVAGWNQPLVWKMLQLRFTYGVPMRVLELVKMKGVGKKIAYSLYNAGLVTPQQCLDQSDKMKGIKGFGEKRIAAVLTSARDVVYTKTEQQSELFEGVHG